MCSYSIPCVCFLKIKNALAKSLKIVIFEHSLYKEDSMNTLGRYKDGTTAQVIGFAQQINHLLIQDLDGEQHHITEDELAPQTRLRFTAGVLVDGKHMLFRANTKWHAKALHP